MRVRGRAGDDAVEVFGVAGHFHKGLPTAGGAAVPIGVLRAFAVVSGHNRFRCDDGVVYGAIAEVDDFFRMPEREHAVAAFVAGIGGRGCVAFLHGLRHGGVADHAGPSAVADDLDLAVPVFGKPDFHFDVGIGGRLERGGDAAVGRKD